MRAIAVIVRVESAIVCGNSYVVKEVQRVNYDLLDVGNRACGVKPQTAFSRRVPN